MVVRSAELSSRPLASELARREGEPPGALLKTRLPVAFHEYHWLQDLRPLPEQDGPPVLVAVRQRLLGVAGAVRGPAVDRPDAGRPEACASPRRRPHVTRISPAGSTSARNSASRPWVGASSMRVPGPRRWRRHHSDSVMGPRGRTSPLSRTGAARRSASGRRPRPAGGPARSVPRQAAKPVARQPGQGGAIRTTDDLTDLQGAGRDHEALVARRTAAAAVRPQRLCGPALAQAGVADEAASRPVRLRRGDGHGLTGPGLEPGRSRPVPQEDVARGARRPRDRRRPPSWAGSPHRAMPDLRRVLCPPGDGMGGEMGDGDRDRRIQGRMDAARDRQPRPGSTHSRAR